MRTGARVGTTTVTAKYQLTVPAPLCRALQLAPGAQLDILPLPKRAGFSAFVRRPSRILDFAGDLKDWDARPKKRASR